MKKEHSIVIDASEGHLAIDFGDRLIITGPGPSTKPRRGEPFLTLCLVARNRFDWESKLHEAHLGTDLTNLITELANVAGAEIIKIFPGKVELNVSVLANCGMKVKEAVESIYHIPPIVHWEGGRPLHPSFAPPYSHAGL